MATLNEICKGILGDVEGAVGCAVVDLNSGLMLASAHSVPYFSQTYIDAVAAASVEMFRGKNIVAVEKLLASQRGVPVSKSIQEMQMTTAGTFHFMSVIPEKPDALVVLITSRKANLGMGWSALRRALGEIAPLCP
ncbi:MAG TPA: hypothetical protein DF427_01260 [Moraxellaceae bacterium]|nr:hypothetical protein [Moraxellaceae bacterium]